MLARFPVAKGGGVPLARNDGIPHLPCPYPELGFQALVEGSSFRLTPEQEGQSLPGFLGAGRFLFHQWRRGRPPPWWGGNHPPAGCGFVPMAMAWLTLAHVASLHGPADLRGTAHCGRVPGLWSITFPSANGGGGNGPRPWRISSSLTTLAWVPQAPLHLRPVERQPP